LRFPRALTPLAVIALGACSQTPNTLPPMSPRVAASNATLTLRIRVPKTDARQGRHRPGYVSPATKALTIAISGPTKLNLIVALAPGVNTVALPLKPCSTASCYTATLAAYDAVTCAKTCSIPAGAHKLSADQNVTLSVVKGSHNVADFTLSGIPAGITIAALHPGYVQGDAHRLKLWGPAAQRIAVLALDADGNTIVGPGAPSISAKSSSATLAVAQPATTEPNVVGLRAVTHGSPAVVTPGTVRLTLTATPSKGSGAGALSISVPVAIAHSALYVATSVSKVDAYYDGNTSSPNLAIVGANTLIDGPRIDQIAVDANGTIYVAQSESQGQILAFPAGSHGNVAPSANINGVSTLIDHAGGVAIGYGTIYVSNITPGLLEFGTGTSGNVTASGAINGSNTTLSGPLGLALDGNGNLYVANSNANSIVEFAAGSSANATPSAIISGANTNLLTPFTVTLDADGSIYTSGSNGSIEKFAPGATGNATPAAIISGANTTLPTYVYAVALDANGTLYAGGGASPYLLEFAKGAHGNVAPVKTFIASGSVYGIVAVPGPDVTLVTP